MSRITTPWHIIIPIIAWLAWGNGIAESQQALAQTRSFQSMNPDVSVDGLFAAAYFSEPENLNFGGHDPHERGFNVQNLELSLQSIVDPYFEGESHFVFGISRGESFLEVEELFFTSVALPFNLQLRGGQFFTRFGRLNPIHPHAWDFVDQPIINNRLLGGDGVRSVGTQLSYLLPLPIYTELIVSMQNPYGETAVSFFNTPAEAGQEPATYLGRPLIEREIGSLADFIYLTRLNSSVELTDTVTMVLGGSALFGPNASGEDTRTTIWGTDLYFKWRPLASVGGWPFIKWQSEVMGRNYEAPRSAGFRATGSFIDADGNMIPQENLKDWGLYSQLAYGFRPRWVAGIRGEYAKGEDSADPLQDRRYRLSTSMSFYPSEFSKWRLQYNYDVSESKDEKPIHALFLEWEFLMGAHGAHQF